MSRPKRFQVQLNRIWVSRDTANWYRDYAQKNSLSASQVIRDALEAYRKGKRK